MTVEHPAVGDAALALGDAKTELWRRVRAGDPRAALEQGRVVEALCEDFRRRFHPRSREVFVTCDHEIGQPLEVFRRTPAGRAVLVFPATGGERS